MSTFVRRIVLVGLVLALAFGVAAAGSTNILAQGQAGTDAPGVWQSSINLQNTGSGEANVQISFYDSSGSEVTSYSPTDPIPAGGSLSIFVPAEVGSLADGQYSAVVSSDQPVLASVNTASTNSNTEPWTAFAYEGFGSSEAGQTLYFPGNYNNYYNFYSELAIQNTSSDTTATVTAVFKDRDGTEIASETLGTVAPNATKTFPMSAISSLPSGNADGLFGAVVTSNEGVPLVGIANIWREQPTNGTASYSGFTGGGASLNAPALYKEYYGFGSALTLQNVGTGTAAGTIEYSNGETVSFNLAEGAAAEYYQPANANLPGGNTNGVFSAKVQATSGEVVGLVSLSIPSGANGDFASYNVPDQASASVNIPNVLSDYYGYFSAVTVQNTGTTTTNITINYATGKSRTFNNVAANGTVNIIHLNNSDDVLDFRTSTSATVSSSNGNELVAVIQHNTAPNVAGYNSNKVPSDFLLATTGVAQ